ncbi:MAG: hypothetical protein AB9907_10980 [Flexilinea sp.]
MEKTYGLVLSGCPDLRRNPRLFHHKFFTDYSHAGKATIELQNYQPRST